MFYEYLFLLFELSKQHLLFKEIIKIFKYRSKNKIIHNLTILEMIWVNIFAYILQDLNTHTHT